MPTTGTEPMAQTLNRLMNGELQAAQIYFQAGAWCSQSRYSGSAEFFINHASEEMMHMQKILQYLMDVGIAASFEALPAPEITSNDLPGLIRQVLEHEKKVTKRYVDATKEAHQSGDISTYEFLQWFVAEQREEEKIFTDILDRIELIGDGPHALYYIDMEVAKVGAAAAAATPTQSLP